MTDTMPSRGRRPHRPGARGRPRPRPAQAARRSRRVRREHRRLPRHRMGRDRLRRGQRHPERALLPERLGHGARRLLGPRERQPRPQGVRPQERLDPLRRQGRRRPGQPARRPPPPPRRRRRRHRPRGARRRPVRRPGPQGRRHGARGADRPHRRARHGAHRRDRDLRRDPPHARAALRERADVCRPVPSRLRPDAPARQGGHGSAVAQRHDPRAQPRGGFQLQLAQHLRLRRQRRAAAAQGHHPQDHGLARQHRR